MQKRRLLSWLTLLSVAVIVLAGCAPRATSGLTASQGGESGLVVDLPALVIDFDASGAPSVGNVPLAQIGATFAPGMLDQVVLDAAMVGLMTESNIQHIQIDNSPNGLLLLVNGQAIPSIRWDGQILSDTGGLISQLGAGTPVLEKMLPVLANLGIGVIVRFPLQEGIAAIPTYVEGGEAATAAHQAQEQFLATVGDTPPSITLPVFFDENGSWRIGDLSETEWTNLTGLPFLSARLNPANVQSIMSSGITELSIYTRSDGLHLSINGRELPYIGWADGEINHVLDLAEQLGLWNTLADQGMNMGELIGMVETLLPAVQSTNTNINIYFPGSLAAASQ
jgi:hypothetical protein